MKSTSLFIIVVALSIVLATPVAQAAAQEAAVLEIGDPAPDFALPGIDGETHTLAEYQQAKILVIAFLANHCPDSQASEARIIKLVTATRDKGVAWVAINPNNPEAVSPQELGYAKYGDSFEEMKLHAQESGFNFPYLYDGETQSTAQAYGCLATPHLFIFDAERKLRYKGYFDDSKYADPATVKDPAAAKAIEALLAGKPVAEPVTKPHGCSTKWLSKKPGVTAAVAQWAETPVDFDTITLDGVAALRANDSKNFRLFNVWATWCPPCREEFPELVNTAHHFGTRDFELITLSIDEEQDAAKAKAFLQAQGAATVGPAKKRQAEAGRTSNNFLVTGADVNALMNVLDPEWPGGVPHSVLIAPGGKILWRCNGPVDGGELRNKILECVGRYYTP